jgi:ABC-2 type transport system ATP-binding protein
MTVAIFDDVHRAYDARANVLNGVSFTLEAGQIVGLLGQNGAGKTTLVRTAMGMLAPDRGAVEVLGLDPRTNPVEVKRRVGYVSEEQILPPFLRTREVLELHRRCFPTWDEDLARALVARFQIAPGTRIKKLSKGQARRVALVCAIAHRPEILFLDEPAGGLDPAARRDFLEVSIQLVNDVGCTILFSSHHMSDVERMADRVVFIHDGGVLLDDELDALRERHSLALLPVDENLPRERIIGIPGCLGARERAGTWHAVFEADPEQTEQIVRRKLPGSDVRCTRIGLEEMFIELVGGQS